MTKQEWETGGEPWNDRERERKKKRETERI